jgi:hypothetical protein
MRPEYRQTISETDTAAKRFRPQCKPEEMIMASVSDKNPQHHTQNMKKHLSETVTYLREDIRKVANHS